MKSRWNGIQVSMAGGVCRKLVIMCQTGKGLDVLLLPRKIWAHHLKVSVLLFSLKKKAFLTHAATSMNLEDLMLSEIASIYNEKANI
jgi:hypothetical protein